MRFRHLRFSAFAVIVLFIILTIERFLFSELQQRIGEKFDNLDIVYLFLILLLPICLPILFKRVRNSRWFAQNFFGISIVTTLMIGGLIGYLLWNAATPTPTAIILTGTLATVGWLTQQAHSENLQRKQHTLNILMNMRQSNIFHRHKIKILSHYPYETTIDEKDVKKLIEQRSDKSYYGFDNSGHEKFPLIESIYYVSNFYEFLASGVKEGDIDKSLLRESLRNVITKFYEKVEVVIKEDQKPDRNGKPTTNVFDNYYDLINNWDD